MDFNTCLPNLSAYQPNLIKHNSKLTAVAVIVINKPKESQLLLLQRAKHFNDPWSGQICLPGGHYDKSDRNLLQTSIRETFEETGVGLKKNHLIAQIDDQQGYREMGMINLTIRPFIFILDQTPKINTNHEVNQYFWIRLSYLMDKKNHVYFTPRTGYADFPGIKIDYNNILWGVSYRIISDFFKIANIPTPPIN